MAEATTPVSLHQLQDEYEDILVRIVVCSYAEQVGQDYLSELCRLNQESGPVPEAALRRMRRARLMSSFHVHARVVYQASKRVLQAAAMFVFAVLVAFSVTMTTVEAARKEVISFISRWSDGLSSFNTKIVGVASGDTAYIPVPARPEQSFAWLPGWAPEGYVEENRRARVPGMEESVTYRKSGTEVLILDVSGLMGTVAIDTENAGRVERIALNGGDGYLIEKNGYTTVWWNDGEYQYAVSGAITAEEALALAKETGFGTQ